jgi:broad specificity phosphatase PhoE
MLSITAFLLTVAIAVPAAAASQDLTTVILVRHAEKAPATAMVTDVPLSAAGAARAKELARVLAAVKVAAIYTTQYQRTQQTAEPLAKQMGIQPVVLTAGAKYAADLAKRIRTKHAGQTVVVVGHANTTPDVLRALGVTAAPAIADSEYDNLFLLTFAPGVAPRLLVLRYGAVAR